MTQTPDAGSTVRSESGRAEWTSDVLGDDYQRTTIPLGTDPDGEGRIEATLVRYRPASSPPPSAGPVLYIHGRSDYFFQRHVAEYFAERGYAFYALDLRKCGRSTRPGQTPHYVTNFAYYDRELDEAMRIIRAESAGAPVLLVAHSTGALTVSLWMNRKKRSSAGHGVSGMILNSPFFDLPGPAYLRSILLTAFIEGAGRLRSHSEIPRTSGDDAYGASIHSSMRGEWDYDLDWKPLGGYPVQFGWLRAVRRAHKAVQRGLDVGVPSLILRSKLSSRAKVFGDEIDVVDAVLDVTQIQRWAGCLGDRTTVVPITDARHDVLLSAAGPRAKAFEEISSWLDWLQTHLDEAKK